MDVHLSSFAQDYDDWSLSDSEVTNYRSVTENEWASGRIVDRTDLAVEHGNLRSLENVRSLVPLGCLEEQEHFDIAQDRHTDGATGPWIESTEAWHRCTEATLAQSDIEVGGWDQSVWISATSVCLQTDCDRWTRVFSSEPVVGVVIQLHLEVHTHLLEEAIG